MVIARKKTTRTYGFLFKNGDFRALAFQKYRVVHVMYCMLINVLFLYQ